MTEPECSPDAPCGDSWCPFPPEHLEPRHALPWWAPSPAVASVCRLEHLCVVWALLAVYVVAVLVAVTVWSR